MRKGAPQGNRICRQCNAVETPLWRAGPAGPKTLCNACGVRWKKGKLVLNECALGLKPLSEAEIAASVNRAPITKAKPVAAAPRRRCGRQAQTESPQTWKGKSGTATDPKVEASNDGPLAPPASAFWTSPAASPRSKSDSAAGGDQDERSMKLDQDERNTKVEADMEFDMDPLGDSLYQFLPAGAEPTLERCSSDLLDDGEDLKLRAKSKSISDLISNIPISPATSSICPESPPTSILSSPLLIQNSSDSTRKLRATVHDPRCNISKSYKDCVLRLSQICLALSDEEPSRYVRAFVHDQSSTLNPCGLSASDSEMHDLVLRGFFCNEAAYSNALRSFREAFSSPELLDFGTHAFTDMLVEDVTVFIPALQAKGQKVAANDVQFVET